MSQLPFSTPIDLADAVHSWLRLRVADTNFPQKGLRTLFGALFEASLQTEEGHPIHLDAIYVQPTNPATQFGWQAVRLSNSMPLTERSLVKLAMASDPKSSAIGVFHNDSEEIEIWGFVDQRDIPYQTRHRGRRIRVDSDCGFFEVSIVAPGRLSVRTSGELIAELNVSRLVLGSNHVDIFENANVSGFLQESARIIRSRITQPVPQFTSGMAWELELLDDVRRECAHCLSSLLIRIQGYHHGGSVLIANQDASEHLDVKYPIQYGRLTNGVQNRSEEFVRIWNSDYRDGAPINLEEFQDTLDRRTEKEAELLDSSIWFAALLSRVDGLILLNRELGVRGFGTVIKCGGEEDDTLSDGVVVKATDAQATRLEPFNHTTLGTRHRSMIKYCFNHSDSLGFVVSQDGDVRAMRRINDHLVIWENVKILNV